MASPNKTAYTTQYMDNWSFDDTYKQNAVENLVYNPRTSALERMVQPGETLPTSGNNASLALGYTGDNLTTITKTINGVQYRKTLSYTGSVLDSVSAWVQL